MEVRLLDTLPREELIERARRLGVAKPEVLTRVELRDEIIRLSEPDERERRQLRGWLGIARDLVASVVEQGLHLPDAAALIRGDITVTEPTRAARPVATVTLAEIYSAQGYLDRALTMLDEVLANEPDHDAARSLRERLRRSAPLAGLEQSVDANEQRAPANDITAPSNDGAAEEPNPSPREAQSLPSPEPASVEPNEAPLFVAAEPASVEASEAPSFVAAEPASVEASEAPLFVAAEPASVEASEAPSFVAAEPASVEASEAPSFVAAEPASVGASEAPSFVAAEAASVEASEAPSTAAAEAPSDVVAVADVITDAPSDPMAVSSAAEAPPHAAALETALVMLRAGGRVALYWQLAATTASPARRQPTLRLLEVTANRDGARRVERDVPIQGEQGTLALELQDGSAVVRAALGWVAASAGEFMAFAVATELPNDGPLRSIVWQPPSSGMRAGDSLRREALLALRAELSLDQQNQHAT
jgi:hypothetical protein